MTVRDQSSPALLPLLPELPLQQQGAAAVLAVTGAVAAICSPATFAQRLVRSLEKLLAGAVGLVVCTGATGQTEDRLLAAGRLDPVLAGRLAETTPVAAGPACLSVEEATVLEARVHEQLQAMGVRALLLLPLTVAGARIGQLLALLPRQYRLTPGVSQTLAAVAGTAALALQAVMERQQLAAQLAAAREQLAAAQEAQSNAEALIQAMQRQRRDRDAVTGLISGRQFHSRLEVEVERARRYRDELGLLLLDIDLFRRFNQVHGRAEGDRVMARLGEILRQGLRKVDHAFRYGGEEFTVILPRCGQRALLELAERLRQRFAAEIFQIDGQTAQLSISIGAAAYRQGASVGSFIRSADEALYRAKAGGRNRVMLA